MAEWAPEQFCAGKGTPLCLYLHVPFCHHRCAFCPFFQNMTRPGFSSEYADWLVRDLEALHAALGEAVSSRLVDAVFVGGGTPSDMEADDLARVLRTVRRLFTVTKDTEITVEGRVRGFTPEKAWAWRIAGANRVSVGLQSTDTIIRTRLGRLADRQEVRAVLNGIADAGLVTIVDLIYGLPGQDVDSVCEDFRFLAEETLIDGLDFYALKTFPGSPMARAVERGALPPPADARRRADLYLAGVQALDHCGFEHFTPQHWRRSAREHSIYNRLAKNLGDLLPVGSSAGGRLGNVMLMGPRSIEAYAAAIESGQPGCQGMRLASQRSAFDDVLAQAVQARRLPSLDDWPHADATPYARVLDNWAGAGLLLGESDGGIRLTARGCYWFSTVEQRVKALARAQSK